MKNNYQKKDLAKNLSNKLGYSVNFSYKLINDLIEAMASNIINSQLNLKNFGTFKLIKKNERLGRNPKTKETFIIKSRKIVKFSVSKKFLNELNKL